MSNTLGQVAEHYRVVCDGCKVVHFVDDRDQVTHPWFCDHNPRCIDLKAQHEERELKKQIAAEDRDPADNSPLLPEEPVLTETGLGEHPQDPQAPTTPPEEERALDEATIAHDTDETHQNHDQAHE